MLSVVLPLHLLFVGLWLGCVLTEALFERALLGQGRPAELILSKLHIRVDLAIEIPAFTLVLITGGLLLQQAHPSTALHVKIAFGLLAIVANAVCVYLVFKRHALAQAGQWEAFERIDHWQHKLGAVVLLAMLAALVIGLSMLWR